MEQRKKLKICYTSDIHGYFYPTTYADEKRENMGLFGCVADFQKDEETLVIDGGDILQGSAFSAYCRQVLQSPETIAQIMNDCGYDFYTLGNHDFNYGQEYLKEYRTSCNGICVCQNVCNDAGVSLFPYQIHTMPNGLKVGIVGIVTDYVNVWEKTENLDGICIKDPFLAVAEVLPKMKQAADVTICVYHGGFECDIENGQLLTATTENIGYRICKELDFDILLTGHQHMSVFGRQLFGTYVVQPTDRAREYCYLEMEIENGKKVIRSEQRKSKAHNRNPFLEEKYQTLQEKIQTWLNQPIGHLNREILPESKIKMALHGSPIADFFNRIQLYFSGAMISSVGLANEIAGFHKEVSRRDIIATYPYPNTLVVCEINGRQLKTAMERSAEYFSYKKDEGAVCVDKSFLLPKEEHYNYDYYMGVTYEIHPENPKGERITKLAYRGHPVEANEKFTLCLNNYRYSGAGGYDVYKECPLIKEINVEMAELIMEYFHENPCVII